MNVVCVVLFCSTFLQLVTGKPQYPYNFQGYGGQPIYQGHQHIHANHARRYPWSYSENVGKGFGGQYGQLRWQGQYQQFTTPSSLYPYEYFVTERLPQIGLGQAGNDYRNPDIIKYETDQLSARWRVQAPVYPMFSSAPLGQYYPTVGQVAEEDTRPVQYNIDDNGNIQPAYDPMGNIHQSEMTNSNSDTHFHGTDGWRPPINGGDRRPGGLTPGRPGENGGGRPPINGGGGRPPINGGGGRPPINGGDGGQSGFNPGMPGENGGGRPPINSGGRPPINGGGRPPIDDEDGEGSGDAVDTDDLSLWGDEEDDSGPEVEEIDSESPWSWG